MKWTGARHRRIEFQRGAEMAKDGTPQMIQGGPDKAICNGCGAQLFFVKNENGKSEPFDRNPRRGLALAVDAVPDLLHIHRKEKWVIAKAHYNHFVTCPKASQFRRPRS